MLQFYPLILSLSIFSLVQANSANILIDQTDVAENKTNFEDLYVDVKFLIAESLDIADLIALAETNEQLSILAADVFRRKFAHKTIVLFHDLFRVKTRKEAAMVAGFDVGLKVLKYYGHMITKLEVVYLNRNEEFIEMTDYLNRYCSATLVRLDISYGFMENAFEKMTKPFERVETVSISGVLMSSANESLTLEKLFPKLRSLSLENLLLRDNSQINYTFPHLEHLHVNLWRLKDFELLLKNNLQIRSLTLNACARSHLKLINNYLPNLERLELIGFHISRFSIDDGERIIFRNVKQFLSFFGDANVPNGVEFEKLEDFSTDVYFKATDTWIDMVEKSSKTLKKLKLFKPSINENQLNKLAMMNLSVDHIYIEMELNVNEDTIIRFVENSKNVKTIQFYLGNLTVVKSITKILRDNFESEWRINEIGHDITLVRNDL